MPTYEYKCLECGKQFEMVQRITDASLDRCIYCQGVVRRVINPVSIVFKGSGFYVTDHGKPLDTPTLPSAQDKKEVKKETKKEEKKEMKPEKAKEKK